VKNTSSSSSSDSNAGLYNSIRKLLHPFFPQYGMGTKISTPNTMKKIRDFSSEKLPTLRCSRWTIHS
jgi:hypothetical protein